MRCLVLGGGGFLGAHLVSKLLAAGHQVVSYGRHASYQNLISEGLDISCVTGDFSTENRWNEMLEGVQVCYHLISTTHPKSSNLDPIADVSGNVLGTLRLLEAARNYSVRIVFTSSGGTVYGLVDDGLISEKHSTNPLCSYGITKLSIEKYLRLYNELHGVKSIILRIANAYGEGQRIDSPQGAVAVFMGRVLRGHTIDLWGDGSVVRDYVYVKDIVNAMLFASEYGGRSSIFNIGSGVGTSLEELLHLIERVTGQEADVVHHPSRGFDVPVNVLDIQKARDELGWIPQTSLLDGLRNSEKWMRRQLSISES